MLSKMVDAKQKQACASDPQKKPKEPEIFRLLVVLQNLTISACDVLWNYLC